MILCFFSVSVERVFENHVSVKSEGACTYLASALVTVSCDYDLTWFPFDSQSCPFSHGSWLYGAQVGSAGVDMRRLSITQCRNPMKKLCITVRECLRQNFS